MGLSEPFQFRINLDKNFGALGAFEELGQKLFRDATRAAGKRAAELIRKKIQGFLIVGRLEWPDNHPITIAIKGFNWPLVDTGLMGDSLQVIEVDQGTHIDYMIGFPPGEAATRALAAEFGKTIRVTEPMRRYFAAIGMPLKASTEVLYVPPRPLFEPAFSENMKEIQAIAEEELEKAYSLGNLSRLGAGTSWDWLVKQLNNDKLR